MNVNDFFGSKFLKGADLRAGEVELTISKLSREQFGDDGVKLILDFKEIDKPLVLNKTNAMRIAKQHGDELEDWVGKRVKLGAEWVAFKGDTVEAVRVQMPAQLAQPATANGATFEGGSMTLEQLRAKQEGV